MNSVNPYEPPTTRPVSPSVKPRRESALAPLFWSSLAGAFIGAMAFGPFFRCPGDPDGTSIAAGVFGLTGLFSAIAHRIRFGPRAEAEDSQSSDINP